MANHGYCKNCWWFKIFENNKTDGQCYASNDSEGRHWRKVKLNNYCPDYTNRNKEKRLGYETLEEWIKRRGYDKE